MATVTALVPSLHTCSHLLTSIKPNDAKAANAFFPTRRVWDRLCIACRSAASGHWRCFIIPLAPLRKLLCIDLQQTNLGTSAQTHFVFYDFFRKLEIDEWLPAFDPLLYRVGTNSHRSYTVKVLADGHIFQWKQCLIYKRFAPIEGKKPTTSP